MIVVDCGARTLTEWRLKQKLGQMSYMHYCICVLTFTQQHMPYFKIMRQKKNTNDTHNLRVHTITSKQLAWVLCFRLPWHVVSFSDIKGKKYLLGHVFYVVLLKKKHSNESSFGVLSQSHKRCSQHITYMVVFLLRAACHSKHTSGSRAMRCAASRNTFVLVLPQPGTKRASAVTCVIAFRFLLGVRASNQTHRLTSCLLCCPKKTPYVTGHSASSRIYFSR